MAAYDVAVDKLNLMKEHLGRIREHAGIAVAGGAGAGKLDAQTLEALAKESARATLSA